MVHAVAGPSASTAEQPEVTDAELVAAMARGDAGALGALYDRYAPIVLALVERIAARGPEAEDLVHDVFLEAWRRSADYDAARGSVKSWLLLRARSRALDYRKSARVARRAGGSDSAWLDELSDLSAEPSLAPDQARLREVLVRLPNEQRTVLLLGYFEGLSSSEIAERVGIPLGTVKSRVAAALASLRQALAVGRHEP
ncbi:MAG: sigma-70 family RNA polymerase sigma factor [Myxococcota bacterium]